MPRCTTAGCAYPLRPEGTLWGEPLPRAAVERAWELAAEADAFVVLDSDLRTAPISLLPSVPLTRGAPLVVVGQTPTQYDRYARILVRAPSAGLLSAVADLIAPEALRWAGGALLARGPGGDRHRGLVGARGDDGPRPGRGRLRGAAGRPPPERARRAWRPPSRRAGGRAVAHPADLRDPGHAQELVAAATGAFGRLDGVVLNAATSSIAPAEQEDPASFDDVLRVNVGAQAALAGAAARAMIGAGRADG